MDEYRAKLIEQYKILLSQNLSCGDIARKLKISLPFAKQLLIRIEAMEAGVPEENIVDELGTVTIKDDIILNDEQKEIILHAWNVDKVEALKEITQRVFGEDLDGRSAEARAIKKFLGTRQLQARPAHKPESKTDKIKLSEEQKEFIRNHIATLSPLEITQSLFSNSSLAPLSAEARAVRYYIENVLPPSSFKIKVSSQFQEVTKEYHPPRTMDDAIKRINAFVFTKLDGAKLNPREKHNTMALIHYLNVHRFQMVMNEFIDERDRELMESSFVRFAHDKGDLSEEEVDLYINWCWDLVHHAQMNRELNQLKIIRDQSLDDKGTPPKALVDQMNKLLEAIDSNQKRQKSAQNDLSGKRRDRVENSNKNNQNVVQLIEGFKDHKKRELIIRFAESRKKVVSDEIDRLTTMDDLKFELFGATKEEILNGL